MLKTGFCLVDFYSPPEAGARADKSKIGASHPCENSGLTRRIKVVTATSSGRHLTTCAHLRCKRLEEPQWGQQDRSLPHC